MRYCVSAIKRVDGVLDRKHTIEFDTLADAEATQDILSAVLRGDYFWLVRVDTVYPDLNGYQFTPSEIMLLREVCKINKVMAIKYCRDTSGASLKSSKDFIDALV